MGIITRSIWVEAITLLYHICSSMIEPCVKIHIYETLCHTGNLSGCENLRQNIAIEDGIQKYAASSLVYMKLIRSLPALIIIIFCGAWSDNIGRKVPILFPFIGMLLSLLLYLISYATPDVFSTLLAGGLLSGLFGEVGLVLMAGYSFVTDVTEKEERTRCLGRLMAMSFIGQFIGSLIVTIVVTKSHVWHVFIVATVIDALTIVIIIAFLQDSLADKTRTVLLCRLNYLSETWQVITRPRENKNRTYIIIILVCVALHQACLWGEYDITMLYVRHRPLEWSASQYSLYLMLGYIASALGTLFLLPFLLGFFKVNDFSLAMAAVGFKVVQVGWQAFAVENWMVYFCLPMMIVSAMFVPALKSSLSKLIAENEVGKMFGLSAFGETLSGLFGSLMFTAVYGASVKVFPGIAFIIEAVLNVILFGLILWVSTSYKKYALQATQDLDTNKGDNSDMRDDYQYQSVKPEPVGLQQASNNNADQYRYDDNAVTWQDRYQLTSGDHSDSDHEDYPSAPEDRMTDDDKPQNQAAYGY